MLEIFRLVATLLFAAWAWYLFIQLYRTRNEVELQERRVSALTAVSGILITRTRLTMQQAHIIQEMVKDAEVDGIGLQIEEVLIHTDAILENCVTGLEGLSATGDYDFSLDYVTATPSQAGIRHSIRRALTHARGWLPGAPA